MNNERYEYYRKNYPDWSDEQIWTAISIDMQTAKTVKDGGEDIDVNNPDVISEILEKASQWLHEVLPVIFEKVKQFFAKAIATVVDWAKRGWEYLMEVIGRGTSWN